MWKQWKRHKNLKFSRIQKKKKRKKDCLDTSSCTRDLIHFTLTGGEGSISTNVTLASLLQDCCFTGGVAKYFMNLPRSFRCPVCMNARKITNSKKICLTRLRAWFMRPYKCSFTYHIWNFLKRAEHVNKRGSLF